MCALVCLGSFHCAFLEFLTVDTELNSFASISKYDLILLWNFVLALTMTLLGYTLFRQIISTPRYIRVLKFVSVSKRSLSECPHPTHKATAWWRHDFQVLYTNAAPFFFFFKRSLFHLKFLEYALSLCLTDFDQLLYSCINAIYLLGKNKKNLESYRIKTECTISLCIKKQLKISATVMLRLNERSLNLIHFLLQQFGSLSILSRRLDWFMPYFNYIILIRIPLVGSYISDTVYFWSCTSHRTRTQTCRHANWDDRVEGVLKQCRIWDSGCLAHFPFSNFVYRQDLNCCYHQVPKPKILPNEWATPTIQ